MHLSRVIKSLIWSWDDWIFPLLVLLLFIFRWSLITVVCFILMHCFIQSCWLFSNLFISSCVTRSIQRPTMMLLFFLSDDCQIVISILFLFVLFGGISWDKENEVLSTALCDHWYTCNDNNPTSVFAIISLKTDCGSFSFFLLTVRLLLIFSFDFLFCLGKFHETKKNEVPCTALRSHQYKITTTPPLSWLYFIWLLWPLEVATVIMFCKIVFAPGGSMHECWQDSPGLFSKSTTFARKLPKVW